MVVVLCAFVQGQSSNAIVKEKGPHGAGLLGAMTSGCCSDSQLLKQATGRRYRAAGVHYACDNGVCDRNAGAARECHQRKSRLGRETIWRATR